jgi:hypothetical protein
MEDNIMIKKDDLFRELFKIDKVGLTAEINDEISVEEMASFSEKYLKQEIKSILGLDIYRYSEYHDAKQPLIPVIFDSLFDNAIYNVLNDEPSLFKDIDIRKYFIPTGDGGFIIFPTPLHALVFNLYFFSVLHVFNSGHFSPKLSKFMGEITIRSTITYDNIFNYENNWYGKAIIKNARILSKDRLNRFIIDKETYTYFLNKFNGIESLSIIDNKKLKKILNINDEFESRLFNNDVKKILNIHIQKIEDTLAKSTQLNIYNLEMQQYVEIKINDQILSYIYTLGNTNVLNI